MVERCAGVFRFCEARGKERRRRKEKEQTSILHEVFPCPKDTEIVCNLEQHVFFINTEKRDHRKLHAVFDQAQVVPLKTA